MPKKRHTPEEIIRRLREAEVALATGRTPTPEAILFSASNDSL